MNFLVGFIPCCRSMRRGRETHRINVRGQTLENRREYIQDCCF